MESEIPENNRDKLGNLFVRTNKTTDKQNMMNLPPTCREMLIYS